MRGIGELNCIIPGCDNIATEKTDLNHYMNEKNQPYPLFCVCHVKGHSPLVIEQSNAYSLIECQTSTCGYGERIEVARDCKEIGPKHNSVAPSLKDLGMTKEEYNTLVEVGSNHLPHIHEGD